MEQNTINKTLKLILCLNDWNFKSKRFSNHAKCSHSCFWFCCGKWLVTKVAFTTIGRGNAMRMLKAWLKLLWEEWWWSRGIHKPKADCKIPWQVAVLQGLCFIQSNCLVWSHYTTAHSFWAWAEQKIVNFLGSNVHYVSENKCTEFFEIVSKTLYKVFDCI